jgi:hypothetical protein
MFVAEASFGVEMVYAKLSEPVTVSKSMHSMVQTRKVPIIVTVVWLLCPPVDHIGGRIRDSEVGNW